MGGPGYLLSDLAGQQRIGSHQPFQARGVGVGKAQPGRLDGGAKAADGCQQRVVSNPVGRFPGRDKAGGGRERLGAEEAHPGTDAGLGRSRTAVEHSAIVPGPAADDERPVSQRWLVPLFQLERQVRDQDASDLHVEEP